jgi:hypothetical protein
VEHQEAERDIVQPRERFAEPLAFPGQAAEVMDPPADVLGEGAEIGQGELPFGFGDVTGYT